MDDPPLGPGEDRHGAPPPAVDSDGEPVTVDAMTDSGSQALETLVDVLGDSAEAWRGAYVAVSMVTALIEMCNESRIPAWMGTGFVHAVGSDFLEVAMGYIDRPSVEASFDRMVQITAEKQAERDEAAARE